MLMNSFLKKYNKLLLFIFWVIVFIINTILVCLKKTDSFDKYVYDMIFYFHNDAITTIFKFITFFGSTIGVISMVILVLLLTKDKRRAFFEMLAVLVVYIFDESIKLIIARPRPSGINLVTEKSYSYPSGHTAIGFVLYGMLIYSIFNSNINKHKKVLYCGLLSILICIVAISRIYLGAHYPSDIIGGFALGNIILISYVYIFNSKLK